MKIIIYGVKNIETRRNIEYFLDENYEIVGYSDGHYPYDLLDGKRFFMPEELCDQEYDFILLTAQSSGTQADIRRVLSVYGVPPEKIIRPVLFGAGSKIKINSDVIDNINRNYKGEPNLIFGLSYSYFGINERDLAATFFNCSYPSMDIYYNLAMYRYMEDRQLLPKLGTILFVMPYYYFDYDMSMSAVQYGEEGHMFALWQLDDWHNSKMVPSSFEYIESIRMFAKKLSQFYHVPLWKNVSYRVTSIQDGSFMLMP
ncbi:MAG: hypothetical protein NC489_33815, partial [Ruminococcus flavefaciens]|nr:hypothetical protein [Ruminococcus flavefaciens]